MPWRSKPRRVFERRLPAGGYVAIEVVQTRRVWRGRVFEGRVVVERRIKARRHGHTPPIIAQAWGRTVEDVVNQLLPSVLHNPTIGSALLRLQSA